MRSFRVPVGRPSTAVLLVVAAVLLLRSVVLFTPLHADEAGYLMVAHSWALDGPNLYGDYFLDRPPLLLALFKLAGMVSWDQAVRVLVLPFAVLFVVAAAWAANQTGGARGARWAAVVGGALMVSPLWAWAADGEMFAAPLVMLSVALTLAAIRRRGRAQLVLGAASGLAAGSALMTKQSFAGGLVFALVLLVVGGVGGRLPVRTAWRVLLSGVAGGAAVLLAVLGYVRASAVGLGDAWYAVFGMRGTAVDVIADHSIAAPTGRALNLVLLATVGGILPLLVVLGLRVRRRTAGPPVWWAFCVTLLVELTSMALGGSYWSHYLVQVAPMLALGVGLAGHARLVRWAGVATAVSAVVVSVSLAASTLAAADPVERGGLGTPSVGDWLAQVSRPGDTATMLYGAAQQQRASGMRSPYPYLWSLPMRTMDPDLRRLRGLLAGPRAPTWLAVVLPLNSWDIDADSRLQHTITVHYRQVATLCGHEVWLHVGVRRRRLAVPARCG